MAKNEEKGEIVLYDKVPQNISFHIKNIYKEGELDKDSTCKEYLQVAHEGGREVRYVTRVKKAKLSRNTPKNASFCQPD